MELDRDLEKIFFVCFSQRDEICVSYEVVIDAIDRWYIGNDALGWGKANVKISWTKRSDLKSNAQSFTGHLL